MNQPISLEVDTVIGYIFLLLYQKLKFEAGGCDAVQVVQYRYSKKVNTVDQFRICSSRQVWASADLFLKQDKCRIYFQCISGQLCNMGRKEVWFCVLLY